MGSEHHHHHRRQKNFRFRHHKQIQMMILTITTSICDYCNQYQCCMQCFWRYFLLGSYCSLVVAEDGWPSSFLVLFNPAKPAIDIWSFWLTDIERMQNLGKPILRTWQGCDLTQSSPMNRYDYIYQINWPGPRNYVPAGEVNEGTIEPGWAHHPGVTSDEWSDGVRFLRFTCGNMSTKTAPEDRWQNHPLL